MQDCIQSGRRNCAPIDEDELRNSWRVITARAPPSRSRLRWVGSSKSTLTIRSAGQSAARPGAEGAEAEGPWRESATPRKPSPLHSSAAGIVDERKARGVAARRCLDPVPSLDLPDSLPKNPAPHNRRSATPTASLANPSCPRACCAAPPARTARAPVPGCRRNPEGSGGRGSAGSPPYGLKLPATTFGSLADQMAGTVGKLEVNVALRGLVRRNRRRCRTGARALIVRL